VFALAACAPHQRTANDGIVVFDQRIDFARGDKYDTAQRSFAVNQDATFVAIVVEDDANVQITLVAERPGRAPPSEVSVDSHAYGEGIELAALDAYRGSRFTVSLRSAQELDRPGTAHLEVLRFDAADTDPVLARRVAAFRAWSAATGAGLTEDRVRDTSRKNMEIALAHFESHDGDATLAAWASLVRSALNYRSLIDIRGSLQDARRAQEKFEAIADARGIARARSRVATALIEIATDQASKEPTADEANREATRTFTELSQDTAVSAHERGRAILELGVLAYNRYDWPGAQKYFLAALEAQRASGSRAERTRALNNLAVIAANEGDFRLATRYFDELMPEFERVEDIWLRTLYFITAAGADSNAGLTDRAIERFLRALKLAREQKSEDNEARALQGLGLAYWARGDVAQAATFYAEALKVHRKGNNFISMIYALMTLGVLARETGDIPRALALHSEAAAMSTAADQRVRSLLQLALDHAAASDYAAGIAKCREALALGVGATDYIRWNAVQLTLAAMLLDQPKSGAKHAEEAASLSRESLARAIERSDIAAEIASRRVLAQSLLVRNRLPEARKEYERAVELIFNYRSSTNNSSELRSANLASEQQTLSDYVDLLMRDVVARAPGKLAPASADEALALRVLESQRAFNFDSTQAQLDGASRPRLDELLTQMAGKRVRIAALHDRQKTATAELEILQFEMAQLRAEIDRLRAASRGVARATSEFPGFERAWPAVRAGSSQLSFALGKRNAYLWVRDASGIRAVSLSASAKDIARELAALAASTKARDPVRLDEVLTRLSTALLPVGAVNATGDTLEIVADGQLAGVPFAALRLPPDRTRRVAERRSIAMISTLYESSDRPAPRRPHALAFAAIAGDAKTGEPRMRGVDSTVTVFPTLRAATAEARAIAAMYEKREPSSRIQLLVGAAGDSAALQRTWEAGVDVIHFATHGLADIRQPLASLLLLPAADAQGNHTYLTAGQVQEWRGDANLVYLSACETAVGPARFASGMPGLQRAFLRAGAHGVIATLWPVDDVYASQFAADFYRRYTQGVSAALALSETQRAWLEPAQGLRENEQAHRRMTAWAHVFYAQ
jgi:CHAT domain-containing protein